MELSKIDVLQRQIDTSIKMYFFDDDVVSIHTLAWASRAISIDLLESRWLVSDLHAIIKKEKIPEFETIVRNAQNYFKHAKKDFDKIIDFDFEVTPYLLLDAISNFYQLTKGFTIPMHCLKLFLLVEHPNLIIDGNQKEVFLNFKSSSKLKKADYWNYLHEAYAKWMWVVPNLYQEMDA